MRRLRTVAVFKDHPILTVLLMGTPEGAAPLRLFRFLPIKPKTVHRWIFLGCCTSRFDHPPSPQVDSKVPRARFPSAEHRVWRVDSRRNEGCLGSVRGREVWAITFYRYVSFRRELILVETLNWLQCTCLQLKTLNLITLIRSPTGNQNLVLGKSFLY